MPSKRLPKELVSLVHHIELNRAGWWERAIQQLLTFMLWINNNSPMELSQLLSALEGDFGVSIPRNTAQRQAERLLNEGTLVRLSNDELKLSESTFRQVTELLNQAQQIEADAKAAFIESVSTFCPSLPAEEVWNNFNDNFLTALVREMGAYTFNLLVGPRVEYHGPLFTMAVYSNFASQYPADLEPALRKLIADFLSRRDGSIRAYILRILNTHFYLEASGLSEEVLKQLERVTNATPSFNIFVDTNFLFSILQLHDNPSNEAAQSLMELCRHLPQNVSVRFYVTPLTLKEAQHALSAIKSRLGAIRVTKNLAAAGAAVKLSGICQRFFEACAQEASLDANAFLDPYINNLRNLLKAQGVELFNQSLEDCRKSEPVIDDILAQQDFEKRRFGDRAKTYEALEHDMTLWHFVRGRRPTYIESPLEAQYWIVSVDYRFLGFDRYKTTREAGSLQVCIHPSALAQMLQLWIPRSEALEEAILLNLRLPLLFQEFDPQAEKVTLTILKTLSRFDTVEDLPVETVTAVLLNESLRARIQSVSEEDQKIELVRDALIEEHARLTREHAQLENQLKKTEEDVEKKTERLEELKEQLSHERERRQHLEHEIRLAREEINELRRSMEVKRFLYLWVFTPPVTIVALGFLVSPLLLRLLNLGQRVTLISFDGLLIIVWLVIMSFRAEKGPARDHKVIRKLIEFRKWVFGVLISGIVINALWEWIKAVWQKVAKWLVLS